MDLARELAKYTNDFIFQDLPSEVLHQIKRVLLDMVGCVIGGYPSEAIKIILELIKELVHAAETTVFGSSLKSFCLNVTLANGAMVRYLNYNDSAFIIKGGAYKSGYRRSLQQTC